MGVESACGKVLAPNQREALEKTLSPEGQVKRILTRVTIPRPQSQQDSTARDRAAVMGELGIANKSKCRL